MSAGISLQALIDKSFVPGRWDWDCANGSSIIEDKHCQEVVKSQFLWCPLMLPLVQGI